MCSAGDGEISIKEFLAQCDDEYREDGALGEMDEEVRFLTEILDDFRRFVDEIWRFSTKLILGRTLRSRRAC